MAAPPAVRLDCVGPIARITFDQPGAKANTLSRAVWTALGEAVSSVACRSDLRGLVLTSTKDEPLNKHLSLADRKAILEIATESGALEN